MAVNWALGLQQGPNPGDRFAQAFQQGQETSRQNKARAAMGALAKDPANQAALAALAEADPETAMKFQHQQIEQHKALLTQHQDSIVKGAQIIRQFNPKDQQSYTAALAAAQAMGVDISQVPQQYNPQYVDGILKAADALKPESGDNMKFLTPQPGGGAYGYDPRTGQITTLIQPNDNPALAGKPVQQGGPPQVRDQASYDAVPPGAQYMTPDGQIRVKQGGQSVAPAGPFQP